MAPVNNITRVSAVGPKPTWNGSFGVRYGSSGDARRMAATPRATPGAATSSDSTNSCRVRRPLEQPSESRMAISRAREAVRASCSTARFAQMIRRTVSDPKMPSADDSTRMRGLMNAGFSKPTFAGSRLTPTFVLDAGYAASSCLAKSAATACVRSRSKPGRSRPTTSSGIRRRVLAASLARLAARPAASRSAPTPPARIPAAACP